MSSLPQKVSIGHITYSIEKKSQREVSIDSDSKLLGTIDYNKKEIEVAAGFEPDHERVTILHELVHAIDYAAGSTLQEGQVDMVAIGLYGLLKDNPKMRKYLFKE